MSLVCSLCSEFRAAAMNRTHSKSSGARQTDCSQDVPKTPWLPWARREFWGQHSPCSSRDLEAHALIIKAALNVVAFSLAFLLPVAAISAWNRYQLLKWACMVLTRRNLKRLSNAYVRATKSWFQWICSLSVNRINSYISELNLEDRSALLPAFWMYSGVRGTSLGSKVFFRVDLQWIRTLICSSSLLTDCLLSVINSVYTTKKITMGKGEIRIKMLNPPLKKIWKGKNKAEYKKI